MTTLIDRSRNSGEEPNRQWLEKGIERDRVEGSASGCVGWSSDGSDWMSVCAFQRCRLSIPASRSQIPGHADHLGGAEVHEGR